MHPVAIRLTMTGLTPCVWTLELIMQSWIFMPRSTCQIPWNEREQFACLHCRPGQASHIYPEGDQDMLLLCYQPLHITLHPITLPHLEQHMRPAQDPHFNSESGQDSGFIARSVKDRFLGSGLNPGSVRKYLIYLVKSGSKFFSAELPQSVVHLCYMCLLEYSLFSCDTKVGVLTLDDSNARLYILAVTTG